MSVMEFILVAHAIIVGLAVAEILRELAEDKGCTAAQLALAWVLAQWECVLPIPGTKKVRYLEDNASAADIELSDADLQEIANRMPESIVHGERYPESMMEFLDV